MSTTFSPTENEERAVRIAGVPNAKQREFFNSRTRFTAYGGARGGGKSWALRRKLVAMCLRYEGLRCLLVRRTMPELKSNHVIPMLREYSGLLRYSDTDKALCFDNGSRIYLLLCIHNCVRTFAKNGFESVGNILAEAVCRRGIDKLACIFGAVE